MTPMPHFLLVFSLGISIVISLVISLGLVAIWSHLSAGLVCGAVGWAVEAP
jgi:hypothetical protein